MSAGNDAVSVILQDFFQSGMNGVDGMRFAGDSCGSTAPLAWRYLRANVAYGFGLCWG